MKKFSKLTALIVSSLMVLSLAACSGKNTPTTPASGTEAKSTTSAAAEKDPIKVGILTALSGVMETWGTEDKQGIELGIEYATKGTNEVNGRKIKLIVEDDTSNAGVAVQKASKLIEQDKVDLITGGVISGNALAVMEKVKASKVPYIISSSAADAITGENFNEYTFRIGRAYRQVTLAGGSFLNSIGKTFYVLAPDNAAGKSQTAAWKTDLELGGGKVIGESYAPVDSTDFTSYLTKIKNAKPDVLVLVIVGDSFTSKLPSQIQELGINKTMKLAADIADIPFLKALGSAGEGMIGPIIYYNSIFDTPENKWFVENFKKKHGEVPDLFASAGFTTGIAIVEGLKKTTSLQGADLIKAFEGLEFKSIKGDHRIRPEDHQTMQPLPVVELKKKDKAFVEPQLLKLVPAKDIEPPITAPGRKK